MAKHALLSASGAHRWLLCTPSAQLEQKFPASTSAYAEEGTVAHALAELTTRYFLGELDEVAYENQIKSEFEPNSYYNAEMRECAVAYAKFVTGRLAEAKKTCPDAMIILETRLDFSKYVPGGFGTGDCIIVADDVLTVIDFKYGKGVAVDSEGNPQMMLYALGALELFDALYDIAEIRMVILQPRIQNLSECTLPLSELLHWAETELKPKAALAAKGDGDFCAGEHCRFCKVKATCRKQAEYNLQLAKYDFAMPDKLTDTEIEAILETADQLVAWASDIKEYALQQSLQGKTWKNWKLVEGRARRAYCSETAAAEAVQAAGFDPYEHKVLGITAMTRMLGKKKFEELLGDLLVKPQGKPTLVPLSDKRPVWNTAQVDFKE